MAFKVVGLDHYRGASTITHGTSVTLERAYDIEGHPHAVRVLHNTTRVLVGYVIEPLCGCVAHMLSTHAYRHTCVVHRIHNAYQASASVTFERMLTAHEVHRSAAVLQHFAFRAICKTRAFNKEITVKVPLRNNTRRMVPVRVNQGVWMRNKHMRFEVLRWHPRKSGMYVRSTRTGAYLHKLAMETFDRRGAAIWEGGRLTCEHRDQDPTNNTIHNLALATKEEQCASRRGCLSSVLGGDVKGVSVTKSGSFLVECKKKGNAYRKTVKSLPIAKLLYNCLARELHGPTSFMNAILSETDAERKEAEDLAGTLLRPIKRQKIA